MKNEKPILAIDARPLTRGAGGIQRYLSKVLPLIIAAKTYRIILYSDRPIKGLPDPQHKGIKIRIVKGGFLASIMWHFIPPFWIRADKVDIFWSPRHHLPIFIPLSCKTVVTLHDFVWKKAPETMPKIQLFSEKLLMPLAIKRADRIICISQTTSNQLSEYYPKSASKSLVILHGNDDIKITESKSIKQEKDYFLTVGTLEPRKNYVRLIKAFNEYASRGGSKKLVIVGKQGWQYKEIYQTLNEAPYKHRIDIINNADDRKLHTLYETAHSFISTSLDEGYGLPPQEASLFGLPLLLSCIDVYLELYPFAELWVDPLEEYQLVEALFTLEGIQNHPRRRTVNNKSWTKSVDDLLESFDRLITQSFKKI